MRFGTSARPPRLLRPAPPDPRTTEGLLRGAAADRVPAALAALVLGLVAPLGAHLPPAPADEPPAAVAPARPTVPATLLSDMPVAGPDDRRIALTFDDGPDPRWTPEVLAALTRHHAVATFCMVGSQMQAHPDLVRVVVQAGMRICSHSHSHDEQLATRPADRIVGEMVDVQERAVTAGDVAVTTFRAPGGVWTQPLMDLSAGHGMRPLGWSIDPRDWKRPGVDAIVAAVQQHVHPGAIVLLHDGGGRREQTVAALEVLLPWLTAQGYTTVFP